MRIAMCYNEGVTLDTGRGSVEEIKKIDIHAHVTAFREFTVPNKGTRYPMVTPEELFVFYDKLNVEKGVLLPIISPEGQPCTYSNEMIGWVASQYPDRFVWFCNVDPRAGENRANADLGYILEFYKSRGAKGLGELTSNLYADDPRMDNLFSYCAALKLPVTVHIAPESEGYYGIVDDIGLPRLEKMLKKHPDLIILGHSQPFWAEMSELTPALRNTYPVGKVKEGRLPKLLREYGNLYCDLSAGSGANALMRDPDYAARFIEEFADRLYYGCDVCASVNTHPYPFNDFLDSMRASGAISEENYRKIVRENAVKLLGL